MKARIYTRVSTGQQKHDSQLEELREDRRRRGWTDVVEHTDSITGTSTKRPQLDQLLADVRRGRVDVVLCFRLDRLGRSLQHVIQLISELTSHGVGLIVPGQGIDTSTSNAAAQLQLNILAAIAQFERQLIVERVFAGLRAAKERGVRLGRPETLSRHREAVAQLVRQGLGIRQIARQLGLPPSSVAKLVKQARGGK